MVIKRDILQLGGSLQKCSFFLGIIVFFKSQQHCWNPESEVILIVFAVASTFVGTAGLSIIANGVAFALGEVVVPFKFWGGKLEEATSIQRILAESNCTMVTDWETTLNMT